MGKVLHREEMLQMEPTGEQMAQPAKGDKEVSRRARGKTHRTGADWRRFLGWLLSEGT